MRPFCLALTLYLSSLAGVAGAPVSGLYSAEVPVATRSEGDRAKASYAAMRAVLVKISGNRGAGRRASVKELVSKAPQLVDQYQYRRDNGDAVSGQPEMLYVRVTFDRAAIEDALRYGDVPVWGKERPLLLVWIMADDEQGQHFLGVQTDQHGLLELAAATAERRGIPVVFPVLDERERAALPVQAFNTIDAHELAGLTSRYRPQSILLGQVSEVNPGFWETRWRLALDGQMENWSSEGELAEDVIDGGLDTAADRLAERFAQHGLQQQEVAMQLVVQGISTLADYARTKIYLDTLDAIHRLNVSSVNDGQVSFELTTRGGRGSVAQAIALGNVLAPIEGHFEGYYRLIGFETIDRATIVPRPIVPGPIDPGLSDAD